MDPIAGIDHTISSRSGGIIGDEFINSTVFGYSKKREAWNAKWKCTLRQGCGKACEEFLAFLYTICFMYPTIDLWKIELTIVVFMVCSPWFTGVNVHLT